MFTRTACKCNNGSRHSGNASLLSCHLFSHYRSNYNNSVSSRVVNDSSNKQSIAELGFFSWVSLKSSPSICHCQLSCASSASFVSIIIYLCFMLSGFSVPSLFNSKYLRMAHSTRLSDTWLKNVYFLYVGKSGRRPARPLSNKANRNRTLTLVSVFADLSFLSCLDIHSLYLTVLHWINKNRPPNRAFMRAPGHFYCNGRLGIVKLWREDI